MRESARDLLISARDLLKKVISEETGGKVECFKLKGKRGQPEAEGCGFGWKSE